MGKEVFILNKKILKKMCLVAMLTAVSVVIGLICKNFFTWNIYYRVTFENLPIIIAGYFFGPLYGAAAGAVADVVSCLFSTNPAVNPVIMLGAATVGALAGLSRIVLKKQKMSFSLAVAVASAHLFGQVLIKSLGKIIFFGMPPIGILLGLAISVGVGILEYFFIRLLLKNHYIKKTLSDF